MKLLFVVVMGVGVGVVMGLIGCCGVGFGVGCLGVMFLIVVFCFGFILVVCLL